MSTTNSDSNEFNIDRDAKKAQDRNSRLSIRKNNEEVLRFKFQKESLKKCDSFLQDFSNCAKENSIFVVFKCRDKNKASK